MATGEELLATIDRAYGARREGDEAELVSFLAPGATYWMNSEPGLLSKLGLHPSDAGPAIARLINLFQFSNVERTDTFISGQQVAFRLRVTTAAPDGSEHNTQFFDIWTFNDEGLVTRIEQFVDTALIASTSEPILNTPA